MNDMIPPVAQIADMSLEEKQILLSCIRVELALRCGDFSELSPSEIESAQSIVLAELARRGEAA
jgi:hypothetical protein